MAGEAFGFGAAIGIDPAAAVAGGKRAQKAFDGVATKADKLSKRTGTAGKRLDSLGRRAKKAGGNVKGLGGAIGGLSTRLIAAAAAGAIVVRGLGVSLDAWRLQEDAIRQVEQRLKSTGGAVGLTSEQLQQMATEMQAVTSIGDELTLAASSLLLTFTKIGGEIFPQTVEITADLAVAMATARGGTVDMAGAAIQLGKALNDPVANLGLLSRAGITFSKVQKETIKGLVESGNLLEAQKIILGELQTQFGGSARAARRETAALTNTLGDLTEEIGRRLDPTVQEAAQVMGTMVSGLIDLFSEGRKFDDLLKELTPDTRAWRKELKETEPEVNFLAQRVEELNEQLAELRRGQFAGGRAGFGGITPDAIRIIEEANVAIGEVKDKITDAPFQAALDRFGEEFNRLNPKPAKEVAKSIKDIKDEAREAAKEAARLANSLELFFEARGKLRSGLGNLQFIGGFDPAAAIAARELQEALEAGINARLEERHRLLAVIENDTEKAIRLAKEAAQLAADGVLSLEEADKWLGEMIAGLGEVRGGSDDVDKTWNRWLSVGSEIVDVLFQMESPLARVAALALDMAAAFREAQKAGKSTAASLAGAAAVGISGAVGVNDRNFRGELTDAGAQIGGVFGPVGALIGAAAGFFVGSLIKKGTETASAVIAAEGDKLKLTLAQSDGQLKEFMEAFGKGLEAVSSNIIASLGGVLNESFKLDLGIELTKGLEDGLVAVIVDGTEVIFKDINNAIAFAVAQSISKGAITGLSPEAQALVGNAAIQTAEGLEKAFALALSLEEARLGPVVIEMRNIFRNLFSQFSDAVKGGVPPELAVQGLSNSLQTLRDELTGTQRSAEEVAELRRQAFNAELIMLRANIELLLIEVEARKDLFNQQDSDIGRQRDLLDQVVAGGVIMEQSLGAIAESTVAAAGVMTEGAGAIASGAAVIGQAAVGAAGAMAGGAEVMAISAAVAVQSTQTTTEALRDLLANLPALIAPGEIKLPSTRRSGRGSGRRAAREAFEDQIEALALLTAGLPEAELAAAQFDLRISELTERMQSAHLSAERQARLIGLLTVEEQQRIQALEAALPTLAENIGELFSSAAGFLAGALEDQDILDDLARAEFLRELDRIRIRFVALQAEAALNADLSDAQRAEIELLAELIDRIDADLPGILEGFGETVGGAGEDFASNVIQAGNAFGNALQALPLLFPGLFPVISGGDPNSIGLQLAQLLQQITGLGGGAGVDPFDAALEQLELMAPFLEAFGLSLEDLTREIEDARNAVNAAAWAKVADSIDDFLADLRGGSQSGLTSLQQAIGSEAELMRLIELASGGDIEAAQQLAAQGQDLLSLAASSLGFGAEAALRQQLQDLLAPFGSAGQAADPILGGLDEMDRNAAFRDQVRDDKLDELIRITGNRDAPRLFTGRGPVPLREAA